MRIATSFDVLHLAPEELDWYVAKDISEGEHDRVVKHLVDCIPCSLEAMSAVKRLERPFADMPE